MPKKKAAYRKKEDWGEAARVLKVMAHPVRLLILDALAERSLCVMDLNSLIPIPQPHLSQHMAALRKAKLVDSHKDGNLRCYYLLRPELVRGTVALLKQKHPIRHRDRESVQKEARGGKA
jgi:ArsR family transcriptional regulator